MPGISDQSLFFERRLDLLENRPQDFPAAFGQASFAAQAGDIPVGFPTVELPGIHNLFPFGGQEVAAEGMPVDLPGSFKQQVIGWFRERRYALCPDSSPYRRSPMAFMA